MERWGIGQDAEVLLDSSLTPLQRALALAAQNSDSASVGSMSGEAALALLQAAHQVHPVYAGVHDGHTAVLGPQPFSGSYDALGAGHAPGSQRQKRNRDEPNVKFASADTPANALASHPPAGKRRAIADLAVLPDDLLLESRQSSERPDERGAGAGVDAEEDKAGPTLLIGRGVRAARGRGKRAPGPAPASSSSMEQSLGQGLGLVASAGTYKQGECHAPPSSKQKKRAWSGDEDAQLSAVVIRLEAETEEGRPLPWSRVDKEMLLPGRNSKQCRDRWVQHLKGDITKGKWSEADDAALYDQIEARGTSWSEIAKHFPGRTDHDIKNHFYSTKRKLLRKQQKEKHSAGVGVEAGIGT